VIACIILSTQIAQERERMRQERAKQRLPTCDWRMATGQSYVCFLSHFKIEAGAACRYLKDNLDNVLGNPVYLDSSNLADLRELFSTGVHTSEVLVLVLTKGLLTRPWCLLEIREAMAQQKPIVLLDLKGGNFNFDEALIMLSDLEHYMPALNPYCLDELKTFLGNEPLTVLQDTVVRALDKGRAVSPRIPELNLNGTSNQLEAQLVDLVQAMATATKRQLTWSDARAINEKLERRKRESTSTRKPPKKVSILHHPAAEVHAQLLQDAMEGTLRERCDRTAPGTPEQMDSFLQQVARSKLVLLLQTAHVLEQPWVLLSLYRAAICNVPMVCVVVVGSGYEFAEAKGHLTNLEEVLSESARQEVSGALVRLSDLSGETHDIGTLSTKLAALVPSLISVVLNPDGSENELSATARDIRDKERALVARLSQEAGSPDSRASSVLERRSSSSSRRSVQRAIRDSVRTSCARLHLAPVTAAASSSASSTEFSDV